MAQHKNWVQRLSDESDLYGEAIPGLPIIEIAGDKRVLIERHNGVIEYGTEQISIRVNYGTIRIKGCGLKLKQMTKQLLIVSGRIDCVQLQRRCR